MPILFIVSLNKKTLMNLELFLDSLKKHIEIFRNYIKSQREFIKEEEKRFNQLARKSVAKEIVHAKKEAEGYQPNSEQQKEIEEKKKLLDQYFKENDLINNFDFEINFQIDCLTCELEHLENGYSETEITTHIYNNYYEFSESNFTAMFEQYSSKATLILVYSIFEFYLKTLCINLGAKVEELKNIDNMKDYLKEEKLTFNTPYWCFLNIVKDLRNCIVHHNSIANNMNNYKNIRRIASTSKITLHKDKKGNTHIVRLSEDFFTMTFENILKFFEDLVKSKQNKANKLVPVS